jgi:rhodanese-related sulfurtransferase
MADIPRISPQEASERLAQGWTYIDVRTPQEFEAGHPAGAVNVPSSLLAGGGMVPNADFVPVMEALYGKDAKLVLGCKTGVRSMKAAQMLAAAGFTSIVDQRAGWAGARSPFGQLVEAGWEGAGLPSEKGTPEGRSWADLQKRSGRG